MRRWLDFAGGLLVGFGVAIYALYAYIWIACRPLLNYMFIRGISLPFEGMIVFLSVPAFSILFGVAIVTVRKRPA